MARQFEATLRNVKKEVEVKYYEGSGHNALFSNPAQFDETVKQVASFLKKNFRIDIDLKEIEKMTSANTQLCESLRRAGGCVNPAKKFVVLRRR